MLKKMLIILTVISILMSIVFTFSGCTNIASKAVEKQTGVSIDASSGEVRAQMPRAMR